MREKTPYWAGKRAGSVGVKDNEGVSEGKDEGERGWGRTRAVGGFMASDHKAVMANESWIAIFGAAKDRERFGGRGVGRATVSPWTMSGKSRKRPGTPRQRGRLGAAWQVTGAQAG